MIAQPNFHTEPSSFTIEKALFCMQKCAPQFYAAYVESYLKHIRKYRVEGGRLVRKNKDSKADTLKTYWLPADCHFVVI